MYNEYSVFNFVNKELEEFVNEYVYFKMKRAYSVVSKNVKRRQDIGNVEFNITVVDASGRKYNFVFYFSNYAVECLAISDSTKRSDKETSDENVKVMEMLLITYVKKFGIEYISDFEQQQLKKEEDRYKQQKANSEKFDECIYIENNHKNNMNKIQTLCAKVLNKFENKTDI